MFFMVSFIVAIFFTVLFPDVMLGFVRRWGSYSIDVAPKIGDSASKGALFVNILAQNSFMILLYFLASLLFLSPLIGSIGGIFYSLRLASAVDHFIRGDIWYPLWASPTLIVLEVAFILLTISFTAALGTEIFGVSPERKGIIDYWKKNWKKLIPEQKRSWRYVFNENRKDIVLYFLQF